MHESQLETLRQQQVFTRVKQLYEQSTRPVAHWMWDNHVQPVAQNAADIADRFHINKEKAVVGALLHDLGDVWLDRHDPNFDAKTETETRAILAKAGFSPEEINETWTEVIVPHSCRPGDKSPTNPAGQALASADAQAHLQKDFYAQMQQMGLPAHISAEQFSHWATQKIKRDFNTKMFFPELKQELKPNYDRLVKHYAPGV